MDADKRTYKNTYRHTDSAYWSDGSTARKLQVVPQYEEESAKPLPVQPQRRSEETPVSQPTTRTVLKPKVRHGIDFISMSILTVAILVTLYTCVQYLKVQSEMVQIKKSIIASETQLTNLTDKNDALYNELASAIDLDYIYQTAVVDLGMVFPNENQVITYESGNDGYVRQYASIPDAQVNSILEKLLP